MTNIPVRLRAIAFDIAEGCPPEVMLLAADELYAYADELYAHAYPGGLESRGGNSTTRSLTMNTMLQESLASIVRWALALGAGYLVKAGIWTEGDATGYVAAGALAIVAIGWSLYQKYTKEEEVVELEQAAGRQRSSLRR